MHRRFRKRKNKYPIKNKSAADRIVNNTKILKGKGSIEGFLEYQQRCRKLHRLRDKYCNKLEFDKVKLAKARIYYFVKKYVLPNITNLSPQEKNNIPGKYLMRVKLSKYNLVQVPKPEPFKLLHNNSNNIIKKKLVRRNAPIEVKDDKKEKFNLNKPSHAVIPPPKKYFYAGIDLRKYGPDPYQHIMIDKVKYYLTTEQIKKVRSSWIKVTPNTHLKDKYRDMFEVNTQKLSSIRIQRFLKKHFFKNTINLSKVQLENIPGRFLFRIKMNDDNMIKPPHIKEERKPNRNLVRRNNSSLPIKHKKNIQENKEEHDLQRAIELSLNNVNDVSYEDAQIDNIIMESIKETSKKLQRRNNIRNKQEIKKEIKIEIPYLLYGY